MRNKDTFSSYHPIINFLYFTLVIGFSMFFTNPFCLIISLITSIMYAIYLDGKKAVKFALYYMLPMFLMIVIVNPAFNHQGMTILTYLPTGNPLTLESIVYGIVSGIMMASVLLWFRCYTAVITSEKFVYLFGRIIPALALILSMALRFIPKFKTQLNIVIEAQTCMGNDISEGSVYQRIKKMVGILSIMITWSLENAIETADSMKSRGYGLPGRTSFSIYRFDNRDKKMLIWLIFSGIFIMYGYISGHLYANYYPKIKIAETVSINILLYTIYAGLCVTPIIINRMEDKKWIHLQSET